MRPADAFAWSRKPSEHHACFTLLVKPLKAIVGRASNDAATLNSPTLLPEDPVFSNGGQSDPVGSLQQYLSSYGETDKTTLFPLNLDAGRVQNLFASLQYQFRVVGYGRGGAVREVPDYSTFGNNCAQFAYREVITAAASVPMHQIGNRSFAETIVVRAFMPVFSSTQDALLLLYSGRLIDNLWGIKPGSRVITYLSYNPPAK